MDRCYVGLVVLGCILNHTEQAMENKAVSSASPWLLPQLLPSGSCLSSYLGLPQYWTMDGNIEDSSHLPTHGTVFCHMFITAIGKNLRHPSSNSWDRDTEFAQLVLYLPYSVPTGCGQPEGKWYQYGRGHPAGR